MKNKIWALIISVFVFFACSIDDGVSDTSTKLIDIDTSQKSFPTAEGYGAYSKGGRGGDVIYVTNLNDSGEGSFRNAVTASGKRIVVFSVSGIIELKSLVIIENPYLTIAGQASPGNGITLKNSGIYIKTHDVIIRHIRIRPGDAKVGQRFEDRDALTIGEDSYSIMIDHFSASWAVDEILSTYYEPQYITIQWCMISEGLSNSRHPEGEHSKGVLVGDNTRNVSIHHNVFAHLNDRSPVQVKGGSNCDVVSNLIYNWGEYAFSFAINYVKKKATVNLMNNNFKKGPSTTGDFFSEPHTILDSKVYIHDNSGDDGLLINFNLNQESWFASKSYLSRNPVQWKDNVTIDTITSNSEILLPGVGATLPIRDDIDRRIISDINNTSGSIIDSPDEVGGYPVWSALIMTPDELAQFDSDKDGMPNDWESAQGLNPLDAADRNSDPDSDGYTNLEEYLNRQ